MSLALAIQTAREQQSLTQTALADQAGVDVRSLKRLESGANTALKTVEAVCSVLNLSPTTGQALVPCKPRLSRKDIKALIRVRNGHFPAAHPHRQCNTAPESSLTVLIFTLLFGIFVPSLNLITFFHLGPLSRIAGFESLLTFCTGILLNLFFTAFSGIAVRNNRVTHNVLLFNSLLATVSMVLPWVSLPVFSIWALPALFSMIGFTVFNVTRVMRRNRHINRNFQHDLEDVIKQLSCPNPNLDALEQTLFGLIPEARSQGDFDYGRPFQVLVWLIQDLRLGITKPQNMQRYFRIAGESAQNITKSDQYAALVKSRQGDKAQQKSLEARRQKLYKKGIRHLKALSRELQSHALSS